MLNRILASAALFATTAGTGILMFPDLTIRQKVAAALLNAFGVSLAGVVNVKPPPKDTP